jgi:LysR family glycine cleavage system transcriptional activator
VISPPKKKTTRVRSAAPKPSEALRRLPLASLRVFVATGEQMSFSRAADMLGVSTGAVSMQIRALEEYLGAQVFRRSGRSVQLTPAGKELLPRVRSALEELELALNAMRIEGRSAAIHISTLASFLQQWLSPRLPAFQALHPKMELRIETSTSLVDFVRSDVQLAIRHGKGQWPGLHAEKLLDDWLVPVCTPEWLRKAGIVRHAEDLQRYKLIHVLSEPWSSWPSGIARNEWSAQGGVDDSVTALRSAIDGQGLALARWSLAASEVAAKRLVVASDIAPRFERAYYLVCPQAYLGNTRVRLFRDWLMQQASGCEPPHRAVAL